MSYNSGSNWARNFQNLKLLARLLPELYSTRSNYYYYINIIIPIQPSVISVSLKLWGYFQVTGLRALLFQPLQKTTLYPYKVFFHNKIQGKLNWYVCFECPKAEQKTNQQNRRKTMKTSAFTKGLKLIVTSPQSAYFLTSWFSDKQEQYCTLQIN